MLCKHAYQRADFPYLLCELEGEPMRQSLKDLAHAVCLHQAHCPKANCFKMTPGYESCRKLAEKPQESAEETNATEATNDTPKKKTRRKASESV